ncbi:MAG: TolC family protein [Flavobacteriales bacterium]|nr:TolC family protein [Flavobacteriales bacterium]
MMRSTTGEGMAIGRALQTAAAMLVCALSAAQVPATLTREAFLRLVLEHHPMARQAALRNEMGDAAVRSARGGFDPVASASYDAKDFDEKNYYSLVQAGLKLPTWYGIDLLAGIEQGDGEFLNPQLTTPNDGLLKAGVRASLGQGLFIDERRAALRKAQAYQRATEGERRMLLNSLLLQALSDHTDWVAAHAALRVSDDAVVLAQIRLDAVRGSWRGGDRPAIDTLEAFLQFQDRLMRQQQAQLNVRNAALRLSNHLWDPSQRPLELQEAVQPDARDLISPASFLLPDTLLTTAVDGHPLLVQSLARIDQLEVDRRLRSEYLKPDLDVEYQWLGAASAIGASEGSRLLGDGQMVGVGFSMPLLLRKERGELALARLRLSDAGLAVDRDRQMIRNRIRERANDIAVLRQQTDLGASMVQNNERLLNGENQRFAAGESSLFLVNAREVPLIDARIRQVELDARLRKAFFALDHEAGTLWNSWTR